MTKEELKEGMKVKFSDPHWGCDVATIVQVNSDVMLIDSKGNSFIREISEIIKELK